MNAVTLSIVSRELVSRRGVPRRRAGRLDLVRIDLLWGTLTKRALGDSEGDDRPRHLVDP